MRCNYKFRAAPRRTNRRRGKSRLAALTPGEDKLAATNGHAMQLRRVVQAQEAAFHAPAFCKLRQHGCDMTSSALHSAWRIQLWEQANDHGLSLPCEGMIGKLRVVTRRLKAAVRKNS
jgi:hypothetical protein